MKNRPIMPQGGIHIRKKLTMTLQEKRPNRIRWELTALAVIGTVSLLMTFLTMFAPLCNVGAVLLFSIVVLLFFAVHASLPDQTHYTLLLLLLLYAIFFYWKREALAAGMMHLMNAVYQTIYFTDWQYFTTDPAYDPVHSATMSLCFAMVPVTWLIVYSAVRFQNFFLSLLVTFPFVEIGYFFGIVPSHTAAGGLVAFWCGMAAVQFAAGKINRNPKELSGFLLRRHVFLPLRDLKYLLPEKAGIFSALTVFVLCLTGEWILQAAHYERPEKIKNMRTDFQYYAASIDWKDVRTILPFLKDKNGDEPDEIVELGRNERREFDNRVVSQISLDAMPLGRVYLKFATYQNYRKSCWRAVEESVRTDPMMQQFEETGFYPPEFLGYAVQSLAYQTARLKLTEPNAPLSRCIPYGFLKDDAVTCHGDLVTDTNTNQYRIFAGENYENLLLRTVSYDVPAVSQLEASPAKMQEALRSALSGHEDTLVQFPQDPSMGSVYYGTEDEMQYRAAAAVLSAAGYTDLAYDAYTTLPDGVCTEYIHKMFGDLTDGFDARNATPAEKMLLLSRLRDRLCANVEYSLSPGKTPPGEDYVLYFLAENRRGYCTHYATTGTLLARLAGIPARYCEGYLVDNTKLHAETAEDGYRYSGKILDSNAHAWTEIYIDGFGWIPYEFTFSYFTPPELPQETEPVTEPEPMTQDPTEAVIVTEIVTEYVPVTAEPTAAPSEVSAPAEIPDRLRDILGVIALAGGLTGLVLLIAARRRRVLSARELRLSDPIGDAAASYAWSLILHRLTECGVNVQAGSTDALLEEMLEKCSHLLTDEELTVLLSIGTRLRYSPHHLKAAERDTVIALYRKLTEQIYFQADPVRKLWLKWVRNYL